MREGQDNYGLGSPQFFCPFHAWPEPFFYLSSRKTKRKKGGPFFSLLFYVAARMFCPARC